MKNRLLVIFVLLNSEVLLLKSIFCYCDIFPVGKLPACNVMANSQPPIDGLMSLRYQGDYIISKAKSTAKVSDFCSMQLPTESFQNRVRPADLERRQSDPPLRGWGRGLAGEKASAKRP